MIYEADDTVYVTAHEDHLARYYCAWKVRVGQELVGVCNVTSIFLMKNSFSAFFAIHVRIKVCFLFYFALFL